MSITLSCCERRPSRFAAFERANLAEYTALLRRYVREPLGKLKLSDLRAVDIQTLCTGIQRGELSPRVIGFPDSWERAESLRIL